MLPMLLSAAALLHAVSAVAVPGKHAPAPAWALSTAAAPPHACDPQGEVCAPPQGPGCPSAYPFATGIMKTGCCDDNSGPCQTCCNSYAPPVPLGPSGVCDDIRNDLPSHCSLQACDFSTEDGVVIDCQIDLLDLVNVEVSVKLDICASAGASILIHAIKPIDVSHKFDTEYVSKFELVPIPIPGSIPWLADAEVELEAGFHLLANLIDVTAALDICGSILGFKPCAGSVVPGLPFNIIDIPITLSSACGTVPPEPTPPPGPPPPDPIPAPPAPPGTTHYGGPKDGKCDAPDETSVTIPGATGSICSPDCSETVGCPTDKPPGTTAEAVCVLANTNSWSTHLGLGSRNVTKGHSWAKRSTSCKACIASFIPHSYCWKDDGCWTVGHPGDPCYSDQCVSASSFSSCHCGSCDDDACKIPPNGCALVCGSEGKLTCPGGSTCKVVQTAGEPVTGVCTYN